MSDSPASSDSPPPDGVTQLLQRIERGDASASQQILPLVYDELRKLAAGAAAPARRTPSSSATRRTARRRGHGRSAANQSPET